jgi:hypothetical protein
MENAHLPLDVPFDRLTVLSRVEGLTALSKAEGLRYPHPSSLRRTQKVEGKSPSAVSLSATSSRPSGSGPNGWKAEGKREKTE